MKEEELLSWLIHQKRHSEIPEVTNKMVDKLIDSVPYLAVLFCKHPIYSVVLCSLSY